MKKKVWILNHYASLMFFEKGGRHHWFAKNLNKKGYLPTIFCSNIVHNKDAKIEITKSFFKEKETENIPYVFVKTPEYRGNGLSRIRNMIAYYLNVKKIMKRKIKQGDIPDIIYASSAHPLTLVAGIKIGQKYKIPVISEVRDLWPESIVAYTKYTKRNVLIKLLYKLERWLYYKSDKLIFTMEGAKEYIINQGWDNTKRRKIDLRKIHHINNGVDYKDFVKKNEEFNFIDEDLESDKFKVIYTGSIRKANNVQKIIDTASIIQKKDKDIIFLIYGDGDELEELTKYVFANKIENVIFKGTVSKSEIPFILSKSCLNIFTYKDSHLKKYGPSLNKMFEYFASGKPTLTDTEFGYDIIKKFNAGFVINKAKPDEWAETILEVKNMDKSNYQMLCDNALKAAQAYDFDLLTNKLIKIIESEI